MVLKLQAEVFQLAKGAGFDNKNAEIAAAIALAESLTYKEGKQYADFDKVGDISIQTATWGASYGGWQVRSLKAQLGTGGLRDAERLPEPQFNATTAYAIWKNAGGKFTPWTTYSSGAYLGYMQQAVYNPVPTLPPGAYRVTGGDTLGGIASKTKYPPPPTVVWTYQLIAAVNRIVSPYTIYPGQVILLPDFPYTVKAASPGVAETLTTIAATYSGVTASRITTYNRLLTTALKVGQVIRVPRYTDWDGKTLTL